MSDMPVRFNLFCVESLFLCLYRLLPSLIIFLPGLPIVVAISSLLELHSLMHGLTLSRKNDSDFAPAWPSFFPVVPPSIFLGLVASKLLVSAELLSCSSPPFRPVLHVFLRVAVSLSRRAEANLAVLVQLAWALLFFTAVAD